jgi:hypothetical protein
VRIWAIAACVTLGFIQASSANPLDSPGTVYIDGVPCNLACQSYMDWSRRTLRATQGTAKSGAGTSAATAPAGKAAGDVSRKRISKRAVPTPVDAPAPKKTQAELAPTPDPLPLPRPRTETAPVNAETREPSRERPPQEQIMAALQVAEKMTEPETPKPIGNDGAGEMQGSSAGDGSAAAAKDLGALVVLVISRPDVKSVSALKGSNIAIDAAQSGIQDNIRAALEAAGATETELSVSDANPLARLISGEVQAAALKPVSPGAAEAFPDIKGFRVLRVPLSPR